jgi:hypothetical protein
MTIWVVAGDQTWSERDAGCWSTPSTYPGLLLNPSPNEVRPCLHHPAGIKRQTQYVRGGHGVSPLGVQEVVICGGMWPMPGGGSVGS